MSWPEFDPANETEHYQKFIEDSANKIIKIVSENVDTPQTSRRLSQVSGEELTKLVASHVSQMYKIEFRSQTRQIAELKTVIIHKDELLQSQENVIKSHEERIEQSSNWVEVMDEFKKKLDDLLGQELIQTYKKHIEECNEELKKSLEKQECSKAEIQHHKNMLENLKEHHRDTLAVLKERNEQINKLHDQINNLQNEQDRLVNAAQNAAGVLNDKAEQIDKLRKALEDRNKWRTLKLELANKNKLLEEQIEEEAMEHKDDMKELKRKMNEYKKESKRQKTERTTDHEQIKDLYDETVECLTERAKDNPCFDNLETPFLDLLIGGRSYEHPKLVAKIQKMIEFATDIVLRRNPSNRVKLGGQHDSVHMSIFGDDRPNPFRALVQMITSVIEEDRKTKRQLKQLERQKSQEADYVQGLLEDIWTIQQDNSDNIPPDTPFLDTLIGAEAYHYRELVDKIKLKIDEFQKWTSDSAHDCFTWYKSIETDSQAELIVAIEKVVTDHVDRDME